MRKVYNILFTLFFWLSAPYYFLKMWRRGGWRAGFGERFARYESRVKHSITNSRVIWLHAVSVGEVNLCTQLIRALEPRLPTVKFLVSTTTATGMAQLRARLPSHVIKIYYPIDRAAYVERALRILHPEAIVLIEAEIWPNFLWQSRRKQIPLFLVNARLSPRSYRGYKRWRFVFGPLFGGFDGVGAQNEADAARLLELGCRPEAVRVVGSLKFDAAEVDARRLLDVPAMLQQIGVSPEAAVLLGGSTHPGEENLLAREFLRLRRQFPGLFLVLVPRHFERGKEVGRELSELGVRFVYRSQVTQTTRFAPGEMDCLLVNTTGELKYFYEAATVIFVGKSLCGEGGQNPIEPAYFGKAMVFGPHMQNFAAIAGAFATGGGAVQVRDAGELGGALEQLLADPARRAELGRRAREIVRQNQGALERTVEMILEKLPEPK